jgi:enamine deaminase RidA (YjgF/YER057c/UK114 family)
MSVLERLHELGLELPERTAPLPGARPNIRPARRAGKLLYLSGNGPFRGKEMPYLGKVGSDLTVEQGYEAAKLTALNLLLVIQQELGDLDHVTWIKSLGMVNSAPGFTQQPAVINGFSDLIVQLYGEERGLHGRSAVGMAELPANLPVEIESILEID